MDEDEEDEDDDRMKTLEVGPVEVYIFTIARLVVVLYFAVDPVHSSRASKCSSHYDTMTLLSTS